MTRNAGKYDTRLAWLKYRPVKDPDTNQVKDEYDPHGDLWANVSDLGASGKPLGAAKIQTVGLPVAQSTTQVRIKNFPAVGFRDQLREKGTDTYYVIDGISRGDDELIMFCTRRQVR
jgi:hypothetical protein